MSDNSLSEEGLIATDQIPRAEQIEPKGRGRAAKKEILQSPTHLTYLYESEARRVLIEWVINLAENNDFSEHSKAEMMEETGLARKTIIDHIDILVDFGLVVEVGSEARPRYRAPHDGPLYDLMKMSEVLASVYDADSFDADEGSFE